jgi:hypothetical protein
MINLDKYNWYIMTYIFQLSLRIYRVYMW